MSERNTIVRLMHDLGAAAWFGGSLMGAVGLNGAATPPTPPTVPGSALQDGRGGRRSRPPRSASMPSVDSA